MVATSLSYSRCIVRDVATDPIPHGTQSGYSYWKCRCDLCVEVKRSIDRAWYVKNREAKKAKSRKWAAENSERKAANSREYREKNADKLQEQKRQYYRDNVETTKERVRAWRAANPEKKRANDRRARERDPEKHRASRLESYYRVRERDLEGQRAKARAYSKTPKAQMANRLRAHLRRGIRYNAEARDWVEIILADPCSYCGKRPVEIEHIEPVVIGGTSEWDNLAPACRSCNASKHDDALLGYLIRRTSQDQHMLVSSKSN